MTTLDDRPNTALLVIDVQAGVVAGNHERHAVVANVAKLVDKARERDVPVTPDRAANLPGGYLEYTRQRPNLTQACGAMLREV